MSKVVDGSPHNALCPAYFADEHGLKANHTVVIQGHILLTKVKNKKRLVIRFLFLIGCDTPPPSISKVIEPVGHKKGGKQNLLNTSKMAISKRNPSETVS